MVAVRCGVPSLSTTRVTRRPVRVAARASAPLPGRTGFSAPLKSSAPLRSSVQTQYTVGGTITTDVSDEQRSALAKEMGYLKIGKPLPDEVNLAKVIGSLPKSVFELNHTMAWWSVIRTLIAMSGCLYLISVSPWYLLPFAWLLAGTAFTGFFTVGHDAGHRAFHKNNLVEDIVGTVMFAPLIYPFEPWRIKHNHHHAHTNKLVEDTAWHPVMPEDLGKFEGLKGTLYKSVLGSPLKCFASIGHWLLWHFDLNKYTDRQKPRVIVSLAAVFAFMAIGWPAIIYYTGISGFVKFWLMPWIGYHFWMSTFTVVHHTAPHIPFKDASEWDAAKAQLGGTVHCNYPRWVEWLCHDINWHVPHHVNAKIPWYNLRPATESLRENWGEYMTECTFNWRMMKNIFTQLHVYDKEQNYVPFDHTKEREDPFLALQRRTLPA